MPEIIEIKKYADFLNKYLKNQNLHNIRLIKGRYKKNGLELKKIKNLLPIKLIKVMSKGKFLYMDFGNIYVCFTLGLTGGFVYLPNNTNTYLYPLIVINENHNKNILNHRNIEFSFDLGKMYFHDQLSFGTMSILTKEELYKKLNSIGPEVLSIDYKEFIKLIRKKSNATSNEIGNVIVDQKLVSGIGNYLRADALWLAKISPFRKVNTLSDKELKTLYESIIILIWNDYNFNYAKKKKIITDNTILPQNYGRDFLIYSQDKDIYNNKVLKEELHDTNIKRFIYWVPKIQK